MRILAALLTLAVWAQPGPGFKADTGKDVVEDLAGDGSVTLTKGTVSGKPARHLKSSKGEIDAVFVEVGVAREWDEAYKRCAELAPKGSWRLPTPGEGMVTVLAGISAEIPVAEGLALPPALWVAGTPEENEEFKGKSKALTVQATLIPSKDGFKPGLQPQVFDLKEAEAGNKQKLRQMIDAEWVLQAAPEGTIKSEGKAVTQEQKAEALKQLQTQREKLTALLGAFKKGVVPVRCVAGKIGDK
ncbi:MAG: hypothetical protein WC728_11560 [Elusimicrobiota bacterium]